MPMPIEPQGTVPDVRFGSDFIFRYIIFDI